MKKKYTCVKCFKQGDFDKIAFQCSNKKNHNGKNYNFEYPKNLFSNKFPIRSICPVCSEVSVVKLCPDCGEPLLDPDTIKIISIVGAKGSGKTVYMRSLINEIIDKFPQEEFFNFKTVDIAKASENAFERDFKISQNMFLPETTQKGQKAPFVIKFVNDKNKEMNLVIYDAAGEEFNRNNDDISTNLRHLSNSTMIIMLVDILQIESVRQSITSELKYEHGTGDPNDYVLKVVVEELQEKLGLNKFFGKKKIDIPIAVSLSLIDLLKNKYTDDDLPNYLMYSQHLATKRFDVISNNVISDGVHQFLKDHKQENFLSFLTSNFKTYNFYAMSSLGGEPINNSVEHLSPQNVLDPLIWLLDRERFLNKRVNK